MTTSSNKNSKPRYCVIHEELREPFDEGFKNIALSFVKHLGQISGVLGITRYGNDIPELNIKQISFNKLFLSFKLFNAINEFGPEVLFYIPYASITRNSFIRSKILQLFCRQKKTVMIAMQPRKYNFIDKLIIKSLKSTVLCVQSRKSYDYFKKMKFNVKILPSGVDLSRFKPVDKYEKNRLRKKYNIPEDKYVVLHIGNLRKTRNLHILKQLTSMDNVHTVIVCSSSVDPDLSFARQLESDSLTLISDYVEKVQEMYQLADCYVFPVTNPQAAAQFPLSVLEAMAVNLPVAATPYGGLVETFDQDVDFAFFEGIDDLKPAIERFMSVESNNRQKVIKFSWANVINNVLEEIADLKL